MADKMMEEALLIIANGRELCNCRQAFYDENKRCKFGCSANTMNAASEVAKAFVELHAK